MVVTQLAAKVGDVHVDGASDQAARVQAPDVLEDFIARDGPAGVGDKITEEFNFADGEFIPLAVVVADFGAVEIKDAVRELDDASHGGQWRRHGVRQHRHDGRLNSARFREDL